MRQTGAENEGRSCLWPHDNSLIAAGASLSGKTALTRKITTELFEASCHFPKDRPPQLWCCLPRSKAVRPVACPSVGAPQAWAAGSAFQCVQACLGIRIDAKDNRIAIGGPVLPAELGWLEVTGLTVGGRQADIASRKHGADQVEVKVIQCDAGLAIEVSKPAALSFMVS